MPKSLDLTDETFGHWTVLSPAPRRGGRTAWNCRCVCGLEREVLTSSLRAGISTNCRCAGAIKPGDKFGRLTATQRLPPGRRRTWWLCTCDCGETAEVQADSLTQGLTRSCGCLHLETVRTKAITHGVYVGGNRSREGHPEYGVWAGMKSRCTNPNNPAWGNYGGRGITYCDRWERYENFIEDMGPRPTDRHTIERLNNDLGYSPSNCIWALRVTQNRNSRNCRYIEIDGTTHILKDWLDLHGVKRATFYARLRRGWTEREAILGR